MYQERIANFEEQLLAERDALHTESDNTQNDRSAVSLDQQSVGRLSRMDMLQIQAMAKAQENRRRQRLLLIDAALRRIEEGEFGYCIRCGEAIPKARLEVDAAAPRCVPCTQGDN